MELIHAACASAGIVLGAFQMVRPKGSRPHRWIGRGYVAAMLVTALSSFWLTGFGDGYSFLHLLSIWVLGTLVLNVRYLRNGNIIGHAYSMICLYGGLLTAGIFAAQRHGMDAPTPVLVAMVVTLWVATIAIAENMRRRMTAPG